MRNLAVFLVALLLLFLFIGLLLPDSDEPREAALGVGSAPEAGEVTQGSAPVVVDGPQAGAAAPDTVGAPDAAAQQAVQPTGQPAVPQAGMYVVQAGDTLRTVAERYGLTPAELVTLNPWLADRVTLTPGDVLVVTQLGGGLEDGIPVLNIAPTSGLPGTLVTVNGAGFPPNTRIQVGPGVQGSSVFYLDSLTTGPTGAFITYVTIPAGVARAGETWVVVALSPELQINVQSAAFTVGGATPVQQTHVVRYGDTLFKIALAYGTTVERLVVLNPQIRNPNLIYPGDVITLR